MREDLDKKLCRTYPLLYRDHSGHVLAPGKSWGFQCHDGWYTIIDVISDLLSKHNPDIICIQCKEKLAALRFYHSHYDSYVGGVVSIAEIIAGTTCEICGAPGVRYTDCGWMTTRCDDHGTGCESPEHPRFNISKINGIGLGWSRLLIILEQITDWHTKYNRRPKAAFTFKKQDNQLLIDLIGGDEETRGMIAFVQLYAQRINEHTGKPNTSF